MAPRVALRRAKRFYVKAYKDNITGMAAMVAYNLLLSIFPLALVALFITSQILSSPELQTRIFGDLQELFPNAAESTLVNLLNQIRTSTTGIGILALITSIWICTSFWGALDTAFARIFHTIDSRSWVQQKRFALAMILVSLLFIAATVALPALQSILASGASDLPLGLGEVRAIVYVGSLAGGVVLLFGILTIIYRRLPYERVPWYAVWPGALAATAAITVVDYAFPAYLSNISTLAGLGTTLIFIVIVLLWFYVMAIIVLGGAVINSIRYENGPPPHHPRGFLKARRRAGAMVQIVRQPESESAPGEATRSKQVADVVLPRDELERVWSPMYLERLAATYWRFLERVSLHLLHIAYGPDSRAVKFLFIPLLTFHAPEYETSADEGTV
ncbi:MAG: rane protein, partial [Thermoleophilaceae bacterium]|nr:rane protein [Thermoleophilaceae bacterium]